MMKSGLIGGRAAVLVGLLGTVACSGANKEEPTATSPGEGLTYTFESLDVSALEAQSGSWCQLPELTPGSYTTLDKESFRDLLADYTVSWLAPIHDGIGAIEERDLFHATFEMVWATFDTSCNWNTDRDLTFGDDELLSQRTQADARQYVSQFIDDATEVSSGDVLRLAVHDCTECYEPLGAEPSFINARLTSDGVLVVEIEDAKGGVFTKTLFITPDAVAIQGDLSVFSTWLKDLNEDTRSGYTSVPQATGMTTVVARKNDKGGVSATIGLSAFDLDTQPDSEDNLDITNATPCIGMHFGANAPTGEVQGAAFLGDVTTTVPGHLLCDTESCGDEEVNNPWVFQLGGLSATAEQPGGSDPRAIVAGFSTGASSRALVGDKVFAEGGLGENGRGGDLSVDVENRSDGYVVTFHPALSFGGAMTISNFSDKFKIDLPDWLEDEIFDLTFGGDKKASVFVPTRQRCSEDYDLDDPPEPARREVEILEGALRGTVGSGEKSVGAGQCVGATLADESELTLTSDWVEYGFTCSSPLQ